MELASQIISYSLMAICWGLMFVVFVRFLRGRIGPVKTVRARVVDKQKVEYFSRTGNKTRCVIVFDIEGEKKSFYVSEFSYDGYRIGEKGKLTYKGDKLISFK